MGGMGRIHYAKLEKSARLQRLLRYLQRGGWFSTREIDRGAEVCAVSTAIKELRMNGFEIESRCVRRGRWEYRLKRAPVEQTVLF